MNAKKKTYLELIERIREKAPGILHIDKYSGQLSDISNYVFPRPAVFISFGRFDYENQSDGTQIADGALIRIRTVVESYSDAYDDSIDQEQALEFFEINEDVHQAVEGWSGTHAKNLTRSSDEEDEDHGNLIVTISEYSCNFIDDSTADTNNLVEVENVGVNVQYVPKDEFPEREEPENYFVISGIK